MIKNLPRPIQIKDYLLANGWMLNNDAIKDNLFVLNNATAKNSQIVLPLTENFTDFSDVVSIVLDKLTKILGKSQNALLNEICFQDDDKISFRIKTNSELDYLPLDYFQKILDGSRDLFISSACTLIKAKAFYNQCNNKKAIDFVDTIKFKHTDIGSFIVNFAYPVEGNKEELDFSEDYLFDNVKLPFARRITNLIGDNLNKIINSIVDNSVDSLILNNQEQYSISYNFCESLLSYGYQENVDSIEIIPTFGSIRSNNMINPKIYTLRKEYFPKIAEMANKIYPKSESRTTMFYGTVEELNGDMGSNDQRMGKVRLQIFNSNQKPIMVNAELNVEQYKIAHKAHIEPDSTICVIGKLVPGASNNRHLIDINRFEIMPGFEKTSII